MKICQIMASKGEGGLEKHFIEVSNALASHHEVHVIADAEYSQKFENITFHAVDMSKSRRNLFLLNTVRKIIAEVSPDVIHAHANKAATVIASIKSFLPQSARLVATLHSLKRNNASFEKFDWVIGVSRSVIENLKNKNKSVIYNGIFVDEKRFKVRSYLSEELKFPENHKLIVSMGRLVPVKRFDMLIEAFQGIKNAQLIIVGDGKERSVLEKKIEITAQKNIHLLGNRLDNIEVTSAADLCVISSEREGFSYVMAESLLVATPVISTDVADMKLILPKTSVVPINNPEVLHELISNSVKNYEELLKSYETTFQWAKENLEFDTMISKIVKVYSVNFNPKNPL